MVLLVAASSLSGISSIHQYVEGQAPKPQQAQQEVQVEGRVLFAIISASTSMVQLPGEEPNLLKLKPGITITLIAPNESFCTLFGLSKISNTPIQFVIPGPAPTEPPSTRNYRVT